MATSHPFTIFFQAEKYNILKSTPLTSPAVFPSYIQLQNVELVLNVFNDQLLLHLSFKVLLKLPISYSKFWIGGAQ